MLNRNSLYLFTGLLHFKTVGIQQRTVQKRNKQFTQPDY